MSKNTSVLWQCKPGTSPKEEEVQQRTPQDYGGQFRRGFGEQIRSTSPPVGHTSTHTPLLTVKLHLAGEEIEAVVDTGESASVVGKRLSCKLGIWKRARKAKVTQGYGSHLGGNFLVNTTLEVMDSYSVLGKFAMDAKVLDIRNRDVILGFSWLTENGFSVDTQDRCLRNVNTGQVIPCSLWWNPQVLMMEEEPLEDGEILLIIEASEQYSRCAQCFSAEQVARLP